ncbi:hypothetical protein KO491_10915 [Roseovarius nubinhibens]|uniref:hypothetical protein n=1 Tax=Roseovarius nubinhibens TaxID=314263 RepID=UPI001C08DBDB|nr:hypothetical protein [Roseovarius nubinhibens]MBU3000346.1 hypothetical protein [Roseovarius nubinhibens]
MTTSETLATSVADAIADEAPWCGYHWTLTSVLGKFPLVLVDLGEFDADRHACTSKVDCANIGKSPYPRAGTARAVRGAQGPRS